jgi:hypothetical protein
VITENLKYARYVVKHRWFVLRECVKLGIPLRGLLHDLSKFHPDEWLPYARYFYGNDMGWNRRLAERAFNAAWLKHQHRNPHHHQHWRLRNDDGTTALIPMSDSFIREMLADWRGAGLAITGKEDITPWLEESVANGRIELNRMTWMWLFKYMTLPEREACNRGLDKKREAKSERDQG